MSHRLSDYVILGRRYTRAVNLERDLLSPGTVEGYVITQRARQVLSRVLGSLDVSGAARAWSLTGVYGTGKSAFAHYLCCLLGPRQSAPRREAVKILSRTSGDLMTIAKRIPDRGLVRAIAVGQREPVSRTVLRALRRGADDYWASVRGRRPRIVDELNRLSSASGQLVPGRKLVGLVRELADASQGGLLLVLDELGKNLEHAAASGGQDDLYLLQQLAEAIQGVSGKPIIIVALLHQAFADYGSGLGVDRRLEWQKIQGRFEDVAFAEAPEEMLHVMSLAISKSPAASKAADLDAAARTWSRHLRKSQDPYLASVLTEDAIKRLLPLHPLTAAVVPGLCTRFAQNDRSLFTFLTGEEPHSLSSFLREHSSTPGRWPTLKLAEAYDYFLAAMGPGQAFRPGVQRWAEIQGVVDDARSLEPEYGALLKTVGLLNLVSTSGALRASRELVTAALQDLPGPEASRQWQVRIDEVVRKGLITYRARLDEYRLWEGSDFDVETAVRHTVASETRPLDQVLSVAAPLSPMIANRHSHETGTLRCFERRYVCSASALLQAPHPGIDGVVAFWVARQQLEDAPSFSSDGRPLIVVYPQALDPLEAAAREAAALGALDHSEPSLQRDGVARREVHHRLAGARRELARAAHAAFGHGLLRCSILGKATTLQARALSSHLSDVCDRVYSERVVLRNELINRRELTSQGARARRELIEAMIDHGHEHRLGLKGAGPEVSMYGTLLDQSGIHQPSTSPPHFGPPKSPDLLPAWKAITDFCLDATPEPRSIERLLAQLQAPPYGLKPGAIPVLLAAVLLHLADEVGFYRDGSFQPVLGAEHFEVLVKQPIRFTVKSMALRGLRLEILRDLEAVLQVASRTPPGLRNQTILSVVRPLVQFSRSLPETTRRTRELSLRALSVREALLTGTEPDEILFRTLPEACGLQAIEPDLPPRATEHAAYKERLLDAIRELNGFYPRRLQACRELLYSAFSVQSDKSRLREDLRVRAQRLIQSTLEARLRAFLHAATDATATEDRWLEAILTIVVERPAEAWSDEDCLAFELRLTELARRFRDVEAVVHDAGAPDRQGFDARRVTITSPDGNEVHRLVWIDEPMRELARSLYANILPDLTKCSIEQQYGVIAALSEDVLNRAAPTQSRVEAKRGR